jgi:hypothetical protein
MVAMGHDFTRMVAPAAIGISYWLGAASLNCQNRRNCQRSPKVSIRTRDEFGCSAFQFGFFGTFGILGNSPIAYNENEIHFHLQLF